MLKRHARLFTKNLKDVVLCVVWSESFTMLPKLLVQKSVGKPAIFASRSRSPTIQRALAMVPPRLLNNGLVSIPHLFPQKHSLR